MSEYFKTVPTLWKQFQKEGAAVRRPRRKTNLCKRIATTSGDRYLATAHGNKKYTRQLSSKLAAATAIAVSKMTIYRKLNEKGLYVRNVY